MTETVAKGGCFTCSKGTATFFWRHGRMEVKCEEFGMVIEKDECEKYVQMQFSRKEPE